MRLKWDNVGKGLEAWGNAYKERNKRDEIEALKIESEKGLGYTDEQAKYLHDASKQPGAEVRFENGHYIVDTPGSAGLAPVSSSVRPTDQYDTGRFSLGGQAYDSRASAENARMGRMADVYRKYGDDNMARQMERDAYQMERDAKNDARQSRMDDSTLKTQGLQQTAAQQQIDATALTQKKQADLDFDIAAAYTLGTPEEQTAAILGAYKRFDPKAAAELERTFDTNTLNKITLRAKEMEQGYAQARQQGVDAIIAYYDKINDGFMLRRDGDTVYKLTNDGKVLGVFAKGDENRLLMTMDAYAKPGGFLELAKHEETIRHNEATENAALVAARNKGGGSGGAEGVPLQPFNVKDFVALAQMHGLGVGVDPVTGNMTADSTTKDVMNRTQALMAVTGMPMHAAFQQVMQMAGTGAAPAPEADGGKNPHPKFKNRQVNPEWEAWEKSNSRTGRW